MTTEISADIHFDPADVRHNYHPADERCHAYGALKIGRGVTNANLYFDNAAHIDAMIAELVALKQEMDPPAAPQQREPGDQVDLSAPRPYRCCADCGPLCEGQGHHDPCTAPRCPGAQQHETGADAGPAAGLACPKCRYALSKPDHDEMCAQRTALLREWNAAPEHETAGSAS